MSERQLSASTAYNFGTAALISYSAAEGERLSQQKAARQVSLRENEAFDPQNLLEAKRGLSTESWWRYADTQLQYYTREYILGENCIDYWYGIKVDKSGIPYEVYDPNSEADGDVINSFQRRKGIRETAEAQGFKEEIEKPIFENKGKNRFFVWHSFPGAPEDGYADYSYTFILKEEPNEFMPGRRKFSAVAYKNWLKAEVVGNFLNRYLPKDKQLPLSQPERLSVDPVALSYLRTPVLLPEGEFKNHLDVIRALDPKRQDLETSINQKNQQLLDQIRPYREKVITALEIEDLAAYELAKNAHDNFALALLKGKNTSVKSFADWSKMETPILRGSCGRSRKRRLPSSVPFITWQGAEAASHKNSVCKSCHRTVDSSEIGSCGWCMGCERLDTAGMSLDLILGSLGLT